MVRLRVRLVGVVLAVVVSFAGWGQTGQAPRLSEKIEVRVVNVDVIVTDRAGKPITGLTREDFEITENKVPQAIVNFYESTPGAYAALAEGAGVEGVTAAGLPAPPPRRVVFYIDNLSLTGVQRNRLIAEMKSFVTEALQPHDEVMIASFNRSLHIALPFSEDRTEIANTLERLTAEAAAGDIRFREAAEIQQDIQASGQHQQRIWWAKSYAERVRNDVEQSANAVKTLMANLAGLDGKKVLVLASEGFPMQPGVEMFAYIDNLGEEVSMRDAIPNRVREVPAPRTPGDQTPAPAPAPLPSMPGMTRMRGSTMVNVREFSAEKIIQSVASTANANGVTLYTVHAGAADGGSSAGADRQRPITDAVVMQARANSEAGLKSLADLTGGLASVTASRHQGIFEQIRRDLDSYYSLGYRPSPGEGERALQVRVKKGRYVVRARRSHVQKSLEQEMSDQVIANLLSQPRANDLNVQVTTEEAIETKEGKFRVPIRIRVPMDSLTLVEQSSGGTEGTFDVYLVVADAGGALSPVVHRTQKVAVAADKRESAKGSTFTYALDLLMNREAIRVSVAIVDAGTSITSFARYDR
ncbi:MAG: VWA domain-containing protein [Acidobacteriota bacterium]